MFAMEQSCNGTHLPGGCSDGWVGVCRWCRSEAMKSDLDRFRNSINESLVDNYNSVAMLSVDCGSDTTGT